MQKSFLLPEEIVARVEHLVSSRTGIIGPSLELPMPSGNPEICVYTSHVCDVNKLSPAVQMRSGDGLALSGAGSSVIREQARAKAYCEAIERYCSAMFNPGDLVVATRDELGESAIDMRLFARGSDEEYQHPRNFTVPPSNQSKLRWVEGYSLISGQPLWVPAVAAYISSPFLYPGEAFTLSITTGCALAASYEQATISGICEVIERDSLMLTWLHQLALPRIDYRQCDNPDFWDRLERVERAGIQQYFFDATSDLGVGTIYALQLAPHSQLGALVMAATKLNPIEAMIKVMDEAASSRIALEQLLSQPPQFNAQDYRSFTRLTDGALFYGDLAQLHAFDFLLRHQRARRLDELPHLAGGGPEAELDRLVEIFRARQLELVVVDLTLPQVRELGLYVVKVIAPQLMPLVINHNLRFTATPRLYAAAGAMGYHARQPHELNPWPQPFA